MAVGAPTVAARRADADVAFVRPRRRGHARARFCGGSLWGGRVLACDRAQPLTARKLDLASIGGAAR